MDQVIKIEGLSEGEANNEAERKEYTYDSIGNVTSMTDGAGNRTVYAYTLTGQLKSVIDALGNKTAYSYDACDRLLEIRQYGEGGETDGIEAKGIDEDLARVQEQNKNRERCHVTRYERDLSGRIVSVMDALGQKESYRYSKKRELLEKVDKEGYLTKYGYTAHGDVKQIQYADGRAVKMSYNPLRQLQKIEDWLGVTKIKNDAAGRAVNILYPDGNDVSYTYGAAGERTSITYPDGKTVHYRYDEHLRLSELKEGDRVIAYGYNQNGDLIHKQFPNGIETSFRYNKKGQLTGLFHSDKEGILDAYRYGYDNLGNKNHIEKERRGLEEESGSYSYGYDAIGRLAEVRKDGSLKRAYTYDAFGNRLGKMESSTVGEKREITYRYNALNQLIKTADMEVEETYTYDKRGNLSQRVRNGQVRNEYLYGALNRLEEVKSHQGEIARYTYNGFGHRIGKQTGLAEIPQVQTVSSLNPVERLREQSFVATRNIDYTIDLTRQYHNLLQSREEGSERNQTQTYLWDGNVAGVYTEENDRIVFDSYLHDDLGSPIRLMDENGVLKEVYGYDEFGQDLYKKEEGYLQLFGYTGYQRDYIAGTYYAQAREYIPKTSRFISEDPIKAGNNWYTYCLNNPLNFYDPLGLDAFIFYLPEWKHEAVDDKKRVKKHYGYSGSEIHLIEVNSPEDLINGWNTQVDSKDMVIINTHADPNSLAGQDENGNWWSIPTGDIQGLDTKDLQQLIIYGCNSGHLDYQTTNVASSFAQIVNGAPVFAADGTVYSSGWLFKLWGARIYHPQTDKAFKDWRRLADPNSTRTNEGWLIYQYASGNLTVSSSQGYKMKLTDLLKILDELNDTCP